ncbi:Zn-dependent hydrolase [Streptomyces sp. NPDC046805]|uniref:Zn-dependent hydrolase n=1 Tax=Streptomyces sp. NPDC046805 TaxID=3155134 RepID=UPI0033C0E382
MHMDTTLKITGARLLEDLATLATFGGREDGGVDRIAGSAADLASREWLKQRMTDCGMRAWSDETGNVLGQSARAVAPWLLVGSHTDTVPAGGRLDGAYGVVAAMEVLRTLIEHDHPAGVVAQVISFWDEEGARPLSQGGFVGSSALCDSAHMEAVRAYIELHIEQGPRMEKAGLELAAVAGIVGVDRYHLRVDGTANHAGTTPLELRADAGRVATRVAAQVRDIAMDVSSGMVANAGCIEVQPGAPNVVPGAANLTVEFRAESEKELDEARENLITFATEVAAQEHCDVQVTQLSHQPVTLFDETMCELVEEACCATERPTATLFSYAGHDAGILAREVPAAMIFVPSSGGVSHSPLEHTEDSLLVRGAQVLLDSILSVAGSRSERAAW